MERGGREGGEREEGEKERETYNLQSAQTQSRRLPSDEKGGREGGRQAAETSEPGGQAHITLEAGSDHLLFKGELRKHSVTVGCVLVL